MTMTSMLAVALLWISATPVQEDPDKKTRIELSERLKTLSVEYKRAEDREERKRIAKEIDAVKRKLKELSREEEAPKKASPPKPGPKAQLQADLNLLYKKFREAKSSAEREKIRADVALVLAELKRLKEAEEQKKSSESDVESLQKEVARLLQVASDPKLPKEDRKRAKIEASGLQKKIKALQGEKGEKVKKPK